LTRIKLKLAIRIVDFGFDLNQERNSAVG